MPLMAAQMPKALTADEGQEDGDQGDDNDKNEQNT